jgi:hypothetical protein
MKQKKEKDKKEILKELRCTMFEYSSSDSDDENKLKDKLDPLSLKKAKSTMALPQRKKKKNKKNICVFIEICSYASIFSPSNL